MIQILQASRFRKAVKKLKPNQKRDLDKAVRKVMTNPLVGEQKKGDLVFLRVYKFSMANQQALLAYSHDEQAQTITLLATGPHENFYRDIKK